MAIFSSLIKTKKKNPLVDSGMNNFKPDELASLGELIYKGTPMNANEFSTFVAKKKNEMKNKNMKFNNAMGL